MSRVTLLHRGRSWRKIAIYECTRGATRTFVPSVVSGPYKTCDRQKGATTRCVLQISTRAEIRAGANRSAHLQISIIELGNFNVRSTFLGRTREGVWQACLPRTRPLGGQYNKHTRCIGDFLFWAFSRTLLQRLYRVLPQRGCSPCLGGSFYPSMPGPGKNVPHSEQERGVSSQK